MGANGSKWGRMGANGDRRAPVATASPHSSATIRVAMVPPTGASRWLHSSSRYASRLRQRSAAPVEPVKPVQTSSEAVKQPAGRAECRTMRLSWANPAVCLAILGRYA